jgi:adenylosuccinate synthase
MANLCQNETDRSKATTKGLVNPTCTGLLGNGVVIHLPSFFEELDALESQGKRPKSRVHVMPLR